MTDITKELTDVYGDSAPSYHTVAKWIAEFNNPTRPFEDVSQSVRSTTAVTRESIRAVHKEVVMRDRQIPVRCIADELIVGRLKNITLRNYQ